MNIAKEIAGLKRMTVTELRRKHVALSTVGVRDICRGALLSLGLAALIPSFAAADRCR